MLHRILAVALLSSLTAPAFGQAPQETHTGRIEPGFINRYAFTPPGSGQLLATLSWDSSAAHLLLILICTVEGEEVPFGLAGGLLDRFARLEAGVLARHPCEMGVMTATSSASYTINMHRSGPEPSAARPPMSAAAIRSLERIVIPGTSRGTEMERIAFRLQHAVSP